MWHANRLLHCMFEFTSHARVLAPCCSGGKTGAKAIAAAEAQAAGLAAAADAEKQRAAAAERRNTDDAVAAARARYLARKAAAGKGR